MVFLKKINGISRVMSWFAPIAANSVCLQRTFCNVCLQRTFCNVCLQRTFCNVWRPQIHNRHCATFRRYLRVFHLEFFLNFFSGLLDWGANTFKNMRFKILAKKINFNPATVKKTGIFKQNLQWKLRNSFFFFFLKRPFDMLLLIRFSSGAPNFNSIQPFFIPPPTENVCEIESESVPRIENSVAESFYSG